MNGLLSMIGMQTELNYLIGNITACFRSKPLSIPKGSIKKLIGRKLTWNDEPVELK